MDMTSAEELGLVWMGDMLLHNDPGGLMINSAIDPHRATFFTEAQQTLDEMRQSAPMYVQDMNNFMMLDDIEDPYFEDDSDKIECESQVLQSSMEEDTRLPTPIEVPCSRKIRPVKHPGLKLQTPIAYQRDTDPNVIPIKKDGMAVCEKCGAIGVKHAFYTKERRFCSLACARGSAEGPPQPAPQEEDDDVSSHTEKMAVDTEVRIKIHANLPPVPAPLPVPEDDPLFPPDKKTLPHLVGTYEWIELLADPHFSATSVSSFTHAPMSNNWDNITVGMKVEVENTDCESYSDVIPDSFWVATVLKIAGYKALLRYEGFGHNGSKDFWINLCSSVVHPVGWCANRGKPLIPPRTIEDKYKDWKHFLVKRLTGARTLPSNFYTKVHESMKSRFRCDLNLEVVDKNRISQVKVATIKHIVGKRLHVRYYDADSSDNGFWAHEDSPLIHPVGWAKRVGQTLAAPPHYVDRCLKGLRDKDDATEDLFPLSNSLPYHTGFCRGMKLEAVDPLNLSTICVSTIMKVLNEGYLLIRIDSYDENINSPGSDWFCYHSSSACILPPGFCFHNDITLTPPKGYEGKSFSWTEYLKETDSRAAPAELFDIDPPEHGFTIGQRLECADLMDPRLVCVATVARLVGRLIKVHFDGWEDEYDQWLDVQSPDMYPVGWCELVSHKLEEPHSPPKLSPQSMKAKGERTAKKRRGRRPMQRKIPGLNGKPEKDEKETAEPDDEINKPINILPSASATPLNTPPLNSQPTKSDKDEGPPRKKRGRPPVKKKPQGINGETGKMEKMDISLSDMVKDEERLLSQIKETVTASVPTNLTGSQLAKPCGEIKDESPESMSVETGEDPGHMQALPEELNLKSNQLLPSKEDEIEAEDTKENTSKLIPRLIDATDIVELSKIDPTEWDENDVGQFLSINNCGPYRESFTCKKIDGKVLLTLTKDQIIDLTGKKVGPSLKIYDLIQQLKLKVNPAQERIRVKKFF
ncbi:polycomb protein Sfmbt isoform X3 [Cimex lectularius]|uniref:Polycomb protein Sfmbt n=1 Tax=Cimex lectularius TaxID=79782 RepID=A0A8I6RSE0_CIMLE|nr:polycomb protein Sfmbt isoform X3 [Cimex lectularius]